MSPALFAERRRIGDRLYGLLLWLLPRSFRARHGGEMLAQVRTLAAEPPLDVSPRLRARYWLRELIDLARTIAREWTRRLRSRSGSHSSPLEGLLEMLRDLAADVAYTVRTLAHRPLYSAVIIVTLALGVGATSAVFSLVDGVLLKPLGYPEPERLVMGYGSFPASNQASVSPPDYLDYREGVSAFETLAATTSFLPSTDLTGDGEPQRLRTLRITDNLFRALRVEPLLGRGFTAEESRDGGPAAVILSHALWSSRFGGDPEIVGNTILLDGEPSTVVGVMPASFDVLGVNVDAWTPLRFGSDQMTVRRFHFLRVIGRLADGIDLRTVQEETDTLAARLAEAYPDSNTGWTMRLVPLHEARFGPTRTPLLVLLGAAFAVLLIGCSNVAMIVLARSTSRTGEVAVRSALGAPVRRLVRLLLTESLVLALAGGLVGVAVAYQVLGLVTELAGTGLPRAQGIALDWRAMAVGLGLALTMGVVFGLVPALRTARADLTGALKSQGRASGSRSALRLRGTLVVFQVALSVTLLAGAGLFLRSLGNLQAVDLGFQDEGVLAATVSLPGTRYEDAAAMRQFWTRLEENLRARPGVLSAGAISILPLTGGNDTWLYPFGQPPEEGSQGTNAQNRIITDGYFETLQVPLLSGRLFDARDAAGESLSLVVDQPLAEALFPEGSAVGQTVIVDLGEHRTAEIIGVVGSVHHFGAASGAFPTMYFSHRQGPFGGGAITVRTDGAAAELAGTLRAVVAEIDPHLPVSQIQTLTAIRNAALDAPRFRTILVGCFATIALLLAAIGVYGVLSYFVAERRREMGLRLALGAEPSGVVRLVLRRGMALVATGLATGLVLSLALGSYVSSLLFAVQATDPLSLTAVLALLSLVGVLACWLPARRTTHIDPVEVMRAD